MQHSIETESRTRKYVKGCWFLLFARKYKRQLLDPGLAASKKKIVLKQVNLWEKIADIVTKSNDDNIERPDENSRNVEEIIIPLEKRGETSKKLRKVS